VTQIFLAVICFVACVFYIHVLIQWFRDTRRAKTIASRSGNEAKERRQDVRDRVVSFRIDRIRRRRTASKPSLTPSPAERHFRGSGLGWSESEQNVHETIARSLVDGGNARVSVRSGARPKAS
jgi:hypothetical protein